MGYLESSDGGLSAPRIGVSDLLSRRCGGGKGLCMCTASLASSEVATGLMRVRISWMRVWVRGMAERPMNVLPLIRRAAGMVVVAAAFLSIAGGAGAVEGARPNIVIFLSDDQG